MEIRDGDARYAAAVKLLPLRWQRPALRLPEEQRAAAEEFRLRAGQMLTVLAEDRERELEAEGGPLTPGELEQMCDRLTGYSRYAASETLRSGYLAAEGGFRVGVCGTAVVSGGVNTNLRSISSLAVRIGCQRPGIAREVAAGIYGGGALPSVLIVSAPGLGKTTLLRDMIRLLSDGAEGIPPRRVSVADERGEIAVMQQGRPQMDVGRHTDVMDGCPKAIAIPMLLRSCNPQVIAVDEITVREDLTAISAAAHCGVALLATIHAADTRELLAKPLFRQLLEMEVFSSCVVIRRQGSDRSYSVETL